MALLTATQQRYALGIIAAVQARGWPQRAAVIAIETALTESGLRMYANGNNPASLALPHDAVGWDHGSVGLFQQQVGGAVNSTANWGTTAQLMDPEISAAKFLDRLAFVDWQHSSNWAAAQAVQGSAFPDGSNYRAHDAEAAAIVASLWGAAPDSNNSQLLSSPGGLMFEILQDRSTGAYYAGCPGYWHHITSTAELDGAAASPLCVNGHRVLGRKSAVNRKFFQMTQPHLLLRRKTYIGK